MILGELIDRYPVALDLLRCIGIRYWYGRGTPRTPWEEMRRGVDCSAFVAMSLVRAGLYRTTEPDRRATESTPDRKSLADICVETRAPKFGDLAIYPGHVMFVLDEVLVIGASGGARQTLGDDPRARVDMHRFDYRHDFVCFGTLRPEHRLGS
jgi:hypothetical protein